MSVSMLNEVLQETNKFFVMTHEKSTYAILTDGISGSFSQAYLVGQYVSIDGSKLNDGVYKITAVSSNKLTLQGTLLAETADIELYGLAIPKVFLDLVTAIETYAAKATDGLSAESQGSRSVSYQNGSGWKDVFKSRLAPYKAVYSDKNRFGSVYNIRTKGY